MVLHVFTSFLGGVPLCIPYGLYSATSLGGTTWRTLGGYPGRVLSVSMGYLHIEHNPLMHVVATLYYTLELSLFFDAHWPIAAFLLLIKVSQCICQLNDRI